MKPIGVLFFLGVLGSCAPKATVVEESPTPATASTEVVDVAPEADELPDKEPQNQLGLLEPTELLGMPDEADMKATSEIADTGRSVISAPPTTSGR